MTIFLVEKKRERPPYGFFKFIGDCIGIVLTCGLWIIGIAIREWRYR